jgi:hypothetical protein
MVAILIVAQRVRVTPLSGMEIFFREDVSSFVSNRYYKYAS